MVYLPRSCQPSQPLLQLNATISACFTLPCHREMTLLRTRCGVAWEERSSDLRTDLHIAHRHFRKLASENQGLEMRVTDSFLPRRCIPQTYIFNPESFCCQSTLVVQESRNSSQLVLFVSNAFSELLSPPLEAETLFDFALSKLQLDSS